MVLVWVEVAWGSEIENWKLEILELEFGNWQFEDSSWGSLGAATSQSRIDSLSFELGVHSNSKLNGTLAGPERKNEPESH